MSKYTQQLKDLLPQGPAWSAELNSTMHSVLEGLGIELSRIDERVSELFANLIPSLSSDFSELIPEWESVVGIPDDCLQNDIQDEDQRRQAIIEKLNRRSTHSVDSILSIIKSFTGEEATIVLYKPFTTGHSRVGDALTNDGWESVWTVNVDVSTIDGPLECIINLIKPAHTVVIFNYV